MSSPAFICSLTADADATKTAAITVLILSKVILRRREAASERIQLVEAQSRKDVVRVTSTDPKKLLPITPTNFKFQKPEILIPRGTTKNGLIAKFTKRIFLVVNFFVVREFSAAVGVLFRG